MKFPKSDTWLKIIWLMSFGLLCFLAGWYNASEETIVHLWLKGSFKQLEEQAKEATKPPKSESEILAEAKKSFTFYPEALKDLPPLLWQHEAHLFVVSYQYAESVQIKLLKDESGQRIEGHISLIVGDEILYRRKKNMRYQYTRARVRPEGVAEKIWQGSLDYEIHHTGDQFGDKIVLLGRTFFDMPEPEIIERFEGKPFAKCKMKHVLNDVLIVLDRQTYKLIKKIEILPIVAKVHIPKVQEKADDNCKDPIHANDIQILKNETQADHFPEAEVGDWLISLRNLDLLLLLDGDTQRIKWYLDEPFEAQHSPRITDRGTVLIFDNLGSESGKNGKSRLLEMDIPKKQLSGWWAAQGDDRFESSVKGRLQLVGDRLFVQEHQGGRFFELVCEDRGTYLGPHCDKKILLEATRRNQFDLAEFLVPL